MKKITTFLLLLFAISAVGQTSTSSEDFFTGKWKVLIAGTPQGDVELMANLSREDGQLKGDFTSSMSSEPIEISAIRESDNSISMDFYAQGYDLTLNLKKVDDDHLEGDLSEMFDAKADRIVETDFFAGQWQVKIHDTPQGDVDLIADLKRDGEQLTGTLNIADSSDPVEIKFVEETESSISIAFYAQGYDLVLNLKKVDENRLEGDLSEMFDAEADRIQKEEDFFAGEWELEFIGTPNGDSKLLMNLIRAEENLTGSLKPIDAGADEIMLTDVSEEEGSITLFFTAQGYDLNVVLEKVDENNLSGSLMDMFDAKAKRIVK